MEIPMLLYYWAAVTASQRREELNPSKSSKQPYKQISGERKGKEQISDCSICRNKGMLFYSHSESSVVRPKECKNTFCSELPSLIRQRYHLSPAPHTNSNRNPKHVFCLICKKSVEPTSSSLLYRRFL